MPDAKLTSLPAKLGPIACSVSRGRLNPPQCWVMRSTRASAISRFAVPVAICIPLSTLRSCGGQRRRRSTRLALQRSGCVPLETTVGREKLPREHRNDMQRFALARLDADPRRSSRNLARRYGMAGPFCYHFIENLPRRSAMSNEREIRNYVYHLWEKAGCPEGRDEFWRRTKAELDAESENPDPATQQPVETAPR